MPPLTDEKPPISYRRQPSRDCEGAVHYNSNFRRFFKGVHMALRPTNGAENPPIGAGSVSDLVWFFNVAVARPTALAEPPLRSTK